MKRRIFAGNWKMNLAPDDARRFLQAFLARYHPEEGREVWLFPPTVSLETVIHETRDRPGIVVGAQHVHWEDAGAFTGELGVAMARQAGARAALVGHSERRHVFGETDADTARKVRALLRHELTPVLCVGELLEERDRGETLSVVHRQLGVLSGLDGRALSRVVIAYEPVWAIGTGRTATPRDASQVHASVRDWLAGQGAAQGDIRILYGGSVKQENVESWWGELQLILPGGHA
jgi:triosephosphate isomerase